MFCLSLSNLFVFVCLHFFFAGLFFKLLKPNANEAATSKLQFFDNVVRIIFATNLLKGMLSLCRGIVPKRVCAIVVRRLCSVMNGSIVHDENNQLFFVELNNDGGRPKLSVTSAQQSCLKTRLNLNLN